MSKTKRVDNNKLKNFSRLGSVKRKQIPSMLRMRPIDATDVSVYPFITRSNVDKENTFMSIRVVELSDFISSNTLSISSR